MPISSERFLELFDRANTLYGWRIQDKRIEVFHEELYHMHPDDIEHALSEMGFQDRFRYQAFKDACYKRRESRLEQDRAKEYAADSEHAAKFFNEMSDETCELKTPKCRMCPRTYCGHVADFAKYLMEKVRHGRVKAVDIDNEWLKFHRGEYGHIKFKDVQVSPEDEAMHSGGDTGAASSETGVDGVR
ncbi:MAG: hypothetical protein ACYTEQ_01725 [Planctomycetota bacterium]